MHAHNCIYEGVFVFSSFFNVSFFCCYVAYHDVTAACMYVPVWGRHTNTMNVDIVKSFSFFLSPKFFSDSSSRHRRVIC